MLRDIEGKCGLVWSGLVSYSLEEGRAGQSRIGQDRGFTSLDPRDAIPLQRRSSA
jgi:hypothetical protein